MRHFVLALIVVLLLTGSHALAQRVVGPLGPEDGPLRKQLWRIPSADADVFIGATVFQPRGRGPFPLVIINHGTSGDPDERTRYRMTSYAPAAAWFVQRGYAVLVPQRPGHGETGGPYLEEMRSCFFANYQDAALAAAGSIEFAMLYVMKYPFVRQGPVLLVGHSAGAFGSLALASRRPQLVKAVISFAGGNGGHSDGEANSNCAPRRLISAAGELGAAVPNPTLWIYAQNDTYFGPDLSTRMADAYRAAGGRAEFHLLPPFRNEGHFLLQSPDAIPIWGPIVDRFFARVGK